MKTSNGLTYTDPQGGVHRISGKLLWSGNTSLAASGFSFELPTGRRLAKVMVVFEGSMLLGIKGSPYGVSIIRVFPPDSVGYDSVVYGTKAQVLTPGGLIDVYATATISTEGSAIVSITETAGVYVEQILLLEENI